MPQKGEVSEGRVLGPVLEPAKGSWHLRQVEVHQCRKRDSETMQLNNKNVETEAKVLKTKGNDAFKQGKFDFAIRYYSDAVILSANDSEKSVLLSNRYVKQGHLKTTTNCM